MPIPQPSVGEKEKDFIVRCMGNQTMIEEYRNESQRYAVCSAQWDMTDD